MRQNAPVVSAAPTWRWWGPLRLALVLLWLLAAGTAWWAAPREQSYDRARADVLDGRVSAYQWGDGWDVDPLPWFHAPTLHASGTLGPLFVWRTPDGRVHWTDTGRFDQVSLGGTVEPADYSGPGAVGIAQHLRAAGLEHRAGDVHPLGAAAVTGLGLLLGAVFLGVLGAGPAPVHGTRWFWFWLVAIAPYGLGLLFWLGRDRPWSRSTAPVGMLGGGERRDRGALGFGLGVLAAILVGAVLLFLHDALGDRWVPRSGG
ncbi:hypothetical protein [Plantactinospora sp. BB1]|uniref:hypothetical protein n=1 Tax=Plantactinospora sp. BB1 TaxID=2071627 RepID=UPI000D17401D|nr:hypothetical protein [Plantactinospora sp. BB1]AVT35761.1 hypothetical protein C6W10_03990 [Plantactinospora sp. BB1]